MTNKSLLAVMLSLPLLLVACDRSETSPTAAADSQNKQASTPDQMIKKAPPAAGMAPADSAPPADSTAPGSTSMPPAAPASPSSTDSTMNQPTDSGAKTNQ